MTFSALQTSKTNTDQN